MTTARRGATTPARGDRDSRRDRAALRARARGVRGQLRAPRRGRGGVLRLPPWPAGGRSVGGHGRSRARPSLDPRDRHAGLLLDQGADGGLRATTGRTRRARSRDARRRLLAGVRRRGQGAHPARLGALPSRRRAGGRRTAHAGAGARLGSGDRRDRGAGAGLGAGHPARLSLPHLRLDPRRGRPPRHRPNPRRVLRGRDGRAARPGLLDRPPRVGGIARGGARSATAVARGASRG